MAPIARLPFSSQCPNVPICPALTGRIVGVDSGDWVKLFNSIQQVVSICRSGTGDQLIECQIGLSSATQTVPTQQFLVSHTLILSLNPNVGIVLCYN